MRLCPKGRAAHREVFGDHLQRDLENCFENLWDLLLHSVFELVDDGSKETQHFCIPAQQHQACCHVKSGTGQHSSSLCRTCSQSNWICQSSSDDMAQPTSHLMLDCSLLHMCQWKSQLLRRSKLQNILTMHVCWNTELSLLSFAACLIV